MIKEKICGTCKSKKLLTEFNKNKTRKDGYSGACRLCDNKRSRKYSKNNPEKNKTRKKKYREENPEKIKQQRINYKVNNPTKDKEYYVANKEKISKRANHHNLFLIIYLFD